MQLSVFKLGAVFFSALLFSALLFLGSSVLFPSLALAAGQLPVPADEPGILDNGSPVSVSTDVPELAGTWGKCLKSVDTRCYFMSVEATGSASILTYKSTRDEQFGEDPAAKPHCYSATERKLAKLGSHTYIWQRHLAAGATIDPARLMKIVVADNALLVYSGEKLHLSLPAVSKHDSAKIKAC